MAIVFTAAIGFGYAAIQQVYRQSANDPQVQYVREAASMIANGADPKSIVPTEKIEISTSLSPFIMVFDKTGNLLASSAVLDGKSVQPPKGALVWPTDYGENRITWQPRASVRQAIVVRRTGGNRDDIVVSGRSLLETEVRISQLATMALIAWLGGLGVSLFATLWIAAMREKKISSSAL